MTRLFYREEVDAEEGMERRVVVAYTHDRETGATSYGATIFRRPIGDSTQVFKKAAHRETALARLQLRPIEITVHGDSYDEVENKIRFAIRQRGVKSRSRKKEDDTPTATTPVTLD